MQIEFFQNLYERYSTLALTYTTDRPIAIKGLERRLIRALKTVGRYGIFERYFYRSLLWHRSGDILQRIQFGKGHSVPSWSWMAYDGAIKYLKVPFGKVEWNTSIVSPFKGGGGVAEDEEELGLPLEIGTQAWDIVAGSGIGKIYLDEPGLTPPAPYKCVVVGVEKSTEPDQDPENYVLIVGCAGQGEEDMYQRVGVGVLRRWEIAFERPGVAIRIQ